MTCIRYFSMLVINVLLFSVSSCSVRDILNRKNTDIDPFLTSSLIHQLHDVTTHLYNHCKLMFFNWSSDHVLLCGDDVNSCRLLLVNFSCAVNFNSDLDDAALDLNDSLPPYLIPPEVKSSYKSLT